MRPARVLPPVLFALSVAVAAALLFASPPADAGPQTMRAAGVIVLAIGLFSTAVVPPYMGALVFLFAAVVLGVAPAPVVFSGFHSGAMWLVFGGLVIGLAVRELGLDARLVRAILARVSAGYLGLLYGITAGAVALAFVLPSAAGRVALLVPIMMALAKRLGFAPGSKGYAGIVLMATMGTMTPAFAILSANVPNMTLYGAAESVFGIQITYGDFLALNFPVVGLGAALLYPLVIWALFRDTPAPFTEEEPHAPWRAEERRLLVILVAALALWFTDTLHGIAPPWVAFGAALVCLAPRVGVLPPRKLTELNYTPLFFLAGAVGLGAVATHAGLGTWLAGRILPHLALSPAHPAASFASILGLGTLIGVFTTMPAQPGVMVTLAQSLADASGWSVNGVVMASVATWTMFPFPYQAPPIIVAVVLADLRFGPIIAMLASYMVVACLIVMPLHYLWGTWLGVFGVPL